MTNNTQAPGKLSLREAIIKLREFTFFELVGLTGQIPYRIKNQLNSLAKARVIDIRDDNTAFAKSEGPGIKYFITVSGEDYFNTSADQEVSTHKYDIAQAARMLYHFKLNDIVNLTRYPYELCKSALQDLISDGYISQEQEEYKVIENEYGVTKLPNYLEKIEEMLSAPNEYDQPESEYYYVAKNLLRQMKSGDIKYNTSETFSRIPYYLALAWSELELQEQDSSIKAAYIYTIHMEYLILTGKYSSAVNKGIKAINIFLERNLVENAKLLSQRLYVYVEESQEQIQKKYLEPTAVAQEQSEYVNTDNSTKEEVAHKISRRTLELQALLKTSDWAATIRNLDDLLAKMAISIADDFGYYHVGIFLIDIGNTNAFLSAASSEGGNRMLQRQYSQPIVDGEIVSNTIQKRAIHIIQDTSTDLNFKANPDLPYTRSEITIPLQVGGQTIGVLDIHSTEVHKFNSDEIQALSIFANQLSMAISNIRLFDEMTRSLEQTSQIYRLEVANSWKKLTRETKPIQMAEFGFRDTEHLKVGYEFLNEKNIEVNKRTETIISEDSKTSQIRIPVILKEQLIGNLYLTKSINNQAANDWSESEIELATLIANQFSVALDRAKLVEEFQRRAAREQTISEIASKISSSSDISVILQDVAAELTRTLSGSEVSVQFNTKENDVNSSSDPSKSKRTTK